LYFRSAGGNLAIAKPDLWDKYQHDARPPRATTRRRKDNLAGGRALGVSKSVYGCGLTALSTDAPKASAFVRAVADEAAAMDAGFALFFFSQALMQGAELAAALRRDAPWLHYAGCSTAGEITPFGLEEGHVLAILFPARAFTVVSTMVRDLSSSGMNDVTREVEALKRSLREHEGHAGHRDVFALCFIDGMSYAEEAVTSALHWGLDDIPLIGGSAGDDMKFETTTLISNGIVASDCAIVALVSTDVPFHVFKTENFLPTGEKLVVTASDPDRRIVREFNAGGAAEEFAAAIGIDAGALTPIAFASHPVVVRVGGEYYCRSIQKVNPDGSLTFFCAIDDGIVLTIAQPKGMVESTRAELRKVGERLGGIDMVLGFDCVLRRLDAQNRQVIREISELYRNNNVIGFGTYGEQYRSMHLNQTFTGIAFGHKQAVA
jgi:hypothetical protein